MSTDNNSAEEAIERHVEAMIEHEGIRYSPEERAIYEAAGSFGPGKRAVYRHRTSALVAAVRADERTRIAKAVPQFRSDPDLMANPEGDEKILNRARELSRERNARLGRPMSTEEDIEQSRRVLDGAIMDLMAWPTSAHLTLKLTAAFEAMIQAYLINHVVFAPHSMPCNQGDPQ